MEERTAGVAGSGCHCWAPSDPTRQEVGPSEWRRECLEAGTQALSGEGHLQMLAPQSLEEGPVAPTQSGQMFVTLQ